MDTKRCWSREKDAEAEKKWRNREGVEKQRRGEAEEVEKQKRRGGGKKIERSCQSHDIVWSQSDASLLSFVLLFPLSPCVIHDITIQWAGKIGWFLFFMTSSRVGKSMQLKSMQLKSMQSKSMQLFSCLWSLRGEMNQQVSRLLRQWIQFRSKTLTCIGILKMFLLVLKETFWSWRCSRKVLSIIQKLSSLEWLDCVIIFLYSVLCLHLFKDSLNLYHHCIRIVLLTCPFELWVVYVCPKVSLSQVSFLSSLVPLKSLSFRHPAETVSVSWIFHPKKKKKKETMERLRLTEDEVDWRSRTTGQLKSVHQKWVSNDWRPSSCVIWRDKQKRKGRRNVNEETKILSLSPSSHSEIKTKFTLTSHTECPFILPLTIISISLRVKVWRSDSEAVRVLSVWEFHTVWHSFMKVQVSREGRLWMTDDSKVHRLEPYHSSPVSFLFSRLVSSVIPLSLSLSLHVIVTLITASTPRVLIQQHLVPVSLCLTHVVLVAATSSSDYLIQHTFWFKHISPISFLSNFFLVENLEIRNHFFSSLRNKSMIQLSQAGEKTLIYNPINDGERRVSHFHSLSNS